MSDNPKQNGENTGDQENERFISDTQKVVQRHLQDKDHVISEEDIRNVRVGMVPPEFLENANDVPEDRDEHIADRKSESDEEGHAGPKMTPWDVVDPGA